MAKQESTPGKYLSRDDIKDLTKELVKEHIGAMGWTKPDQVRLNLREMYETVLYPGYEFELITDIDLGYRDNVKVLGKVIMEDKVVLIDRSIAPPNHHPQFIFTAGHEFGHSVLHPGERETFRCTQLMIGSQSQSDYLEVQANAFSENLLMPDYLVRYRFLYCYRPTRPFVYIGRRDYWFEAEGVSRKYSISSYTDYCTKLGSALCKYFCNTSMTSMGLKIHRLGLVQNRTAEEWGQEGMWLGDVMGNALAGMR